MESPEYFTSEQFIWENLIERAELGIGTLYDTWKKEKRIPPFTIMWPATPVKDRLGAMIDGPCMRSLSEDKSQWRRQMVEAIGLTNAYALLLVQQRDDHVLVILESQHGVVNWALPITRSADVYVLGRPKRSEEGEHVGLLWRPNAQLS